MLTRGDDYPIHQTPDPIAYAGTDRNFYDRYFFNGYAADGGLFFALAFGVYPHLNIADAHFSIVKDNVQHCVHASKLLAMERMDLSVGPIRIDVLEPLQRLKLSVGPHDGIAAELEFVGRAFPVEEPRFVRRIGPRSFMDYTRMTQNGHWRGWIEIDGARYDVSQFAGTRDRSWGVRPIGASDAQPIVPVQSPQFFWLWSPVNFDDGSLFFHINADQYGRPWNMRAVWCADGKSPDEMVETEDCQMRLDMKPGWRHAASATLDIGGAAPMQVSFKPFSLFLMRGIGYGHPEWPHGGWKGELAVDRENIDLASVTAGRADHLHIQALSHVVAKSGETIRQGVGVLEQFILGPYQPLGLETLFDG